MTPQEISEYELFLNKKHLVFLKDLSNKEIREEDVQSITNFLDRLLIYLVYCKHECSFDKIFRLTINKTIINANERLKDIRNLKYPPNKKAIWKYGRCNLPEQSILYASLMGMTSLDEMKPKTGDLITETIWKTKSTKPLIYIPIFSNQPTNGPMMNRETGESIPFLTNMRTLEMNERFEQQVELYPKNLKELSLLVVQFIADCFSKKVNSENHFNYIFSAYIADKFLNKVENDNIGALYYPSVPDKLNSENLAIKPTIFDELYDPWGVIESIVVQDPSKGRGGYEMTVTAACNKFDLDTNEILWDEKESNNALFQVLNSRG